MNARIIIFFCAQKRSHCHHRKRRNPKKLIESTPLHSLVVDLLFIFWILIFNWCFRSARISSCRWNGQTESENRPVFRSPSALHWLTFFPRKQSVAISGDSGKVEILEKLVNSLTKENEELQRKFDKKFASWFVSLLYYSPWVSVLNFYIFNSREREMELMDLFEIEKEKTEMLQSKVIHLEMKKDR